MTRLKILLLKTMKALINSIIQRTIAKLRKKPKNKNQKAEEGAHFVRTGRANARYYAPRAGKTAGRAKARSPRIRKGKTARGKGYGAGG